MGDLATATISGKCGRESRGLEIGYRAQDVRSKLHLIMRLS